MKKYMLTAILLGLALIGLQINLWVGNGGLLQYWQLKKQLAQQIDENGHLKARNNILQAEVMDLKEGSDAIEERARVELGMIKSGEKFYQITGQQAHE